jgi:hypothetical protein
MSSFCESFMLAVALILLSTSYREPVARAPGEGLMAALRWYRNGNADFADCLIAALNTETGAPPTYTFDETTASSSVFALLS